MPISDDRDGRTGFLAGMVPRGADKAPPTPQDQLAARTGLTTEVRLSTPGHEVAVAVCPGTDVATDPQSGAILLLHGEIHPASLSSAQRLLTRYLDLGIEALGAEDGSYALLVVDPSRDRVAVVTDRWNTRRVFHSFSNGCHWLSTARTLPVHPHPSSRIDPAGVGHYLINGLPYNGRTLFDGLSVLDRASVHAFRAEGIDSRAYWRLEFSDCYVHLSEARLHDELLQRLVAAVEKRLDANRPSFLALSGGWDSGSILGVAGRLGAEDLRCLSYGEAEGGQGTDAALAARAAARLGYRHDFVPGYGRELSEILEVNETSEGTCQLVMEIDAWARVAELLRAHGDPPPLLLGDQGIGCRPAEFATTRADALRSIKVRDARWIQWLRPFLDRERFGVLAKGLLDEQNRILDRVPDGIGLDDTRYWLYMDQYLTRLLAYREFFAGQWSRPRYPLLDYDLIDFVLGLPAEMRSRKRILKDMAAERFPEVFDGSKVRDSGPRVRSWLGDQLRSDIEQTRVDLNGTSSPLDELLPPEALDALLNSVSEGWLGGRRQRLWRRARRDLKESGFGGVLGRRIGLERRGSELPPALLVRALFLRGFLRRRIGEPSP